VCVCPLKQDKHILYKQHQRPDIHISKLSKIIININHILSQQVVNTLYNVNLLHLFYNVI